MSEKKYTPCGGCGATEPIQRCLGCAHPFRPIETPMTGRWVNLSENYTEDWAIMHCRFADDKYKLDTNLFDEKDGCLIKKGGTGAVRLSEVEYLIESESPAEQPVADNSRYELSLALRDLIKLAKHIGCSITNYNQFEQRIEAAEAMLKKHSKVTDVLRAEQPGREAKP